MLGPSTREEVPVNSNVCAVAASACVNRRIRKSPVVNPSAPTAIDFPAANVAVPLPLSLK